MNNRTFFKTPEGNLYSVSEMIMYLGHVPAEGVVPATDEEIAAYKKAHAVPITREKINLLFENKVISEDIFNQLSANEEATRKTIEQEEAEKAAKIAEEQRLAKEAEKQRLAEEKAEAKRQAILVAERQAALEAERQAAIVAERQAEVERLAAIEAEKQAQVIEAQRLAEIEIKKQAIGGAMSIFEKREKENG